MSRIVAGGMLSFLIAAVLLAQAPKPQVIQKRPAGPPTSKPTPRADSVFGTDRHAVVVGVNDYADDGIPDLRMAEADAKAVHQVLTDPSIGGVPAKQATLLLGKSATTREVRRALARLRALPKRATVFVYFSGHGMTEAGDGYWITQDAEINDLAASCLSDTELRKFLGDVAAERLLVMIDACYAAATVNGQQNAAKGIDDVLQRFTGKGHAFLSAAGDGEQALEANDLKHSVFTHFLLQGLRGKADEDADGVVVLPELTNYLDAHVADEARRRQGIQKPVVDLKGVQEPKKFQLVIDALRLLAVRTAAAESQAARERRLAKLRALALDEKLSVEQHREGKRLLEADRLVLTTPDQLALVEYERVLDGKLAPEKLALALKLISTTPSVPRVVTGTDGSTLRSSAGIELVLIPAGEFLMGSPDTDTDGQSHEKPQRKVKITWPFYLGKHEVTKGQFATFVAAKGYKTEPERNGEGGWGYDPATNEFDGRKPQYTWRATGWTAYEDDHPVVNITWNDAVAFCNWQSEAEALTPCYRAEGASFVPVAGSGYRLPTEAEWEYACRAGTTTRYSSGNDPESLATVGNVPDGTAKQKFGSHWKTISASDGFAFAAPVGKFKANAFGLHDMHGNVWEWCADWIDLKYYATRPELDPQGPAQGSYRVFRGGGWHVRAADCRSAGRSGFQPGACDHVLGFRVARSSSATLSVPRVVTGTDPNTLKSSAGIELVLIPAGEFLMGSPDSDANSDEKPQRRVKITRPFYLGKYEVTKGQFAKFVTAKNYKTEPERDGEGGWGFDPATGNLEGLKPQYTWRATGWTPYEDDHPVVNITWNDAVAFCNWQSEAEALTPCYRAEGASFVPVAGNGYRLPTEAEWEYACRAGTTTRYASSNDPETLATVGNVADRTAMPTFSSWTTISASDGFVFTAPMGKYKANAFGLHDMHGNVWEWCGDWYDEKSYATRPELDPQGPTQGSDRVRRGGSWYGAADYCRSALRFKAPAGYRRYNQGFRVARSSGK